MLFWRTLQCQINIDAISGRYCIDIGNIIGSIYFSNIKPILQKTIFVECWVWISSQYWDCILAQYLVNNFAIGSIIFQGTPQYQVNIDPITTWYCLDIGIIIGSIYFSNIKPILQKTIFAEYWVWISSQYWDCILAQYLVNKFCYLGSDRKVTHRDTKIEETEMKHTETNQTLCIDILQGIGTFGVVILVCKCIEIPKYIPPMSRWVCVP